MSNFTNYHIIKVSYLGATNSKGSRVKMTTERFGQSKIISYNYAFRDILTMAQDYLTKAGFEVVGHAEGKDCYYVITNTFKGLKQA